MVAIISMHPHFIWSSIEISGSAKMLCGYLKLLHSEITTIGQWNQNHVKRLKSGKCRENWILPRKSQQPEEIFTLFQLVVDHSRKFPLSGIVVNFLGDHVPIGSVINIHFIKKTCVSYNTLQLLADYTVIL